MQLRRDFRLPGMRVLQFGFDGSGDNPHLPHNYTTDVVGYTGTHDNDTTLGWYRSLSAQEAARVDFYLHSDAASMLEVHVARHTRLRWRSWRYCRSQDLLQLGSEARFNTPGTTEGNWGWRMPPGSLTGPLAAQYAALNQVFGRSEANA